MTVTRSAPAIGFVMGTVFLIVGFNYGNIALWMLGFIFLALGLYSKFHKKYRMPKTGVRHDSR